MSITTKIRLTILASAVALAAAFAQGAGTWYQGTRTDPGGVPDVPAGRHAPEIAQKNAAPSGLTPTAMPRPSANY